MILKALYDYYHRDRQSVPFGKQVASISFIIVINKRGEFIRVEDSRTDKKGTNYLVPVGTHNNGISPLLFWDNVQYLLDYIPQSEPLSEKDAADKKKVDERESKINKSHEKHLAFVKRCQFVAEKTQQEELLSVSYFYSNNELRKVYNDPLWGEIKKNPLSWLSFRVEGSLNIVACNVFLRDFNNDSLQDSSKGICLITGNKAKIARLCLPTPIPGAKSSAKLVAFNDSSFCSYGKEQGDNAPISQEAEFAFSSALLKLKSEGSRNKFTIGNRTFLFWASKDDEAGKQSEESIFNMFGFNEQEDDPNRNIEQVRKVFEAINLGTLKTTSDDMFYILGLAPNSARIAVTYWAEIPLRQFAGTICRHFNDMDVVDMRPEKKPYMSLRNIISAVTLGGKVSDAAPNLPESVVKSIFEGLPYPQTLFASCVRRIRAESGEKDKNPIYITRAAIIKSYLNRLNNNQKPIEAMLDKENSNQGYLCGRLFAVLDKIQEEANNQHSIRERYMNSASSTPAAVFSTILNLSNHHLENLKNEGRKIYFEKLKQEIISKIEADGFKAQLDLQDQGRFFIGYYHQRQDFFSKNESVDNNE